jgi:hypothetical protein
MTAQEAGVPEISPEISPEIIDWDERGRAADYLALGSTDGGREVVVAVSWDGARRSIRPITAWEAE